MNELVSKTELIDDLKKDIAESDNWLAIAIYLAITVRIMSYKNIDAVEVVYCKDCKHKEYCSQNIAKFGKRRDMYEDISYCSYGERRTE